MSEAFIVRRDLDFLLHEWLRAHELLDQPRFADHSRDTFDAVLDLSEQVATDLFLPHYKDADRIEPHLDVDGVHVLPAIGVALREYAALGLFSAGFSPDHGGMGLPYLLCSASFAIFAAANIATIAYQMLTVANARLIATFGSAAQIERFALPQIEGRWFGTMCLSEPQAGSSLADVRTRAVPDGDSAWGPCYRLTGNKMWISGGDQDVSENIVHLVLAKVAGTDGLLPEGTAGLSLFIVPKLLEDGVRNDIAVAGLNHKMGYRGTANCLLNLGENGGAAGWMVGAPGQGLKQMFLMMNEARIGVGIGAASLGYRGYRQALSYAQDRMQGRLIDVRGGSPVAIVTHPDVRRMLLAAKTYAEGGLALCLYCARLVDEEMDGDAAALLGLLTPIAKTWPSEYGLVANDIAIQIHGGYGYTRDFDVEQLYRDNRLNPIHEGTTGIQATDLLGRKLLRGDGVGLAVARRRIATTCAAAASVPDLADHGVALAAAWERIAAVLEGLRAVPGARAYDNATPFLAAFGHAVLGWLWLDQAVLATGRLKDCASGDRAFYAGKLRACRFFFESELPKLEAWLGPVATASDVAATMPPDQF